MQEYIDLLMQISRITGLAPPDDTRYDAVLELRLRDPRALGDTPAWLLRNEQVPFSRFLAADSWSEVQLRPHNRLRALIVIANPADLQAGAGACTRSMCPPSWRGRRPAWAPRSAPSSSAPIPPSPAGSRSRRWLRPE